MVQTKKVRFLGDVGVDLPTLGVHVEPGDEIDVPDDFNNASFEAVAKPRKSTKEENV